MKESELSSYYLRRNNDQSMKFDLEKEMATYSNILAWRNPWTEEPGGL